MKKTLALTAFLVITMISAVAGAEGNVQMESQWWWKEQLECKNY